MIDNCVHGSGDGVVYTTCGEVFFFVFVCEGVATNAFVCYHYWDHDVLDGFVYHCSPTWFDGVGASQFVYVMITNDLAVFVVD